MDVAIGESRKHQLSARVDHLGAHAAHPFDDWVVANRNDLPAVNGHRLRPRLLRVFRVHAAMDHDDVRWLDDEALSIPKRETAKRKNRCLRRSAKESSSHSREVRSLRMLAAC